MARRSRSEPLMPTCPLCGTSEVEVLGHDGVNDQLTVLRCTICERTWNEVVTAHASEDEEAPA